jgi:hypothetical protein
MAFITAATRSDIVELAMGMLNQAPSTAMLNTLIEKSTAGSSIQDLADYIATTDAFTAEYPSTQTAREFATEMFAKLITGGTLDAAINTAVIDLLEGLLTAGTTKAAGFVAVIDYLSNTANNTNADLGDISKSFQNRASAAEYFSITKELGGSTDAELAAAIASVTSDAATLTAANTAADTTASAEAVVAGQTFTLTTGLDTPTGATSDDTFSATAATVAGVTVTTLNAGDNLKGGDGTDTLSLSNTSATSAFGAGINTSSIENLSVNAVTTTSVDASLMAGLTGITNNGSLAALTVSGLTTIPTVSVIASSANTTATIGAAATVGTADEMTVTLNGASTVSASTITAEGIEKFNVNATGTASGALTKSITLQSATLKDVAITGTAASALTVNLGGATTATAGSVTGNAAANTVALTADAADTISVDLGAGNDLIVLGAISKSQTIAGGDGIDTLVAGASITNTALVGTGLNVSGFEAVSAGAVSVALPTATNTISAVSFTGDGGSVAGVASGATIAQAAAGTNTVSNTTGWTGAADSLNVVVGSVAAGGALTQSLVATGVETATITNNQLATSTDTRSVGVSSASLTKMTVISSIDAPLTITGGGKALAELDASGVVGDVTESVTLATAGSKVTTGTGDDTITFVAGANTAVTGDGKDTVTGGTGADTITTGAGADTITGGKGNDVMDAGAGKDTITGGEGADTMTGGADADTFIVGGSNTSLASYSTATAPDVIKDFVSGTDKLTVAQTNASFIGNYANLTLALADMTAVNQSFFVTSEANLYVVATQGTYASTDTVVKLEGVTAITENDLGFGSQGTGSAIAITTGVAALSTTESTNASASTTGLDDTISITVANSTGNISGKSAITGGAGNDTLNISTTAAGLTVLNGVANNDEINVSGVEVINIAVSDAGAGAISLTNTLPTDLTTLTASGVNVGLTATLTATGQTVTVTNGLLGGQGSVISMGAFAGTVTTGSANDTVNTLSTLNVVSTGAGDDTITVTAASDGATGAIINAGAGTLDTISIVENITADTTFTLDSTRITGVEKLSITEDASHAITTNLLTGMTTLVTVATGGGTMVINVNGTAAQMNALTSATFGATGAAQNLTITAAGVVDLTDITMANASAFNGSSGNDTLSITDAGADGFILDGKAGTDILNITTALGAVDDLDAVVNFETINLAGAANSLTLQDAMFASGTSATISAAALTAGLTIDADLEDDVTTLTIIGSGFADSISGTGGGKTTVTAGAGNDTVHNQAGGGVMTVDLGTGADIFRVDVDLAAADVISGGFVGGVAGDRIQIDVSEAGLGTSTITSGAAITAGAAAAATVFAVIDTASEAIAATSNVLVLAAGTYADAAAAVAALNAGGALASPTIPTASSTAVADNSPFLIIYENTDGDAVIAGVLVNGAVAAGAAMAFDGGDDLVTLTGVSVYTGSTIDLIASNLQFA